MSSLFLFIRGGTTRICEVTAVLLLFVEPLTPILCVGTTFKVVGGTAEVPAAELAFAVLLAAAAAVAAAEFFPAAVLRCVVAFLVVDLTL